MKKKVLCLLSAASLLLSACAGREQSDIIVEDQSKQSQTEREMNSEQSASVQDADKESADTVSGENADENTTSSKAALSELLHAWGSAYQKIISEDITAVLDEAGIPYAGYYNKSGERLDITLEDETELIFLATRDPDMNDAGYELIMADGQFNEQGFQENYLNCYDVIYDDYYYPALSERLLEEDELWELNQTDLAIMRNELFAKHGRTFDDAFLQEVFSLKNWYEPSYTAQEFDTQWQELLTDIEKENLQQIMNHEVARGYRKSGTEDYEELQKLMSGSWIDLNADGEKEQVFFTVKEQEEGQFQEIYKIELSVCGADKTETMIQHEGWNLHDCCYVAATDNGSCYLVICDYGISADNAMSFYQYEGESLSKIGEVYTYPEGLKLYKDRLTAMEESYHFQCQPVQQEYKFEDGTLIKQKKDYYDYRQNIVTAIREIVLYTEKDSESMTLTIAPGDEVQVMGGDMESWVLLQKTATGEEGWLQVENMHECILDDGSVAYSGDLFEGLTFYG